MNQAQVKKQTEELFLFFSKNPDKIIQIASSDYNKLISGIDFLLERIESIQKDISEELVKNNFKNLIGLRAQIDKNITDLKGKITLKHSDIVEILKIYKMCLNYGPLQKLSSEEWLSIVGCQRFLEIQRLS